jgi:hypothetical protein
MNVQGDVKRCHKLFFTINMRLKCGSGKLIMNTKGAMLIIKIKSMYNFLNLFMICMIHY